MSEKLTKDRLHEIIEGVFEERSMALREQVQELRVKAEESAQTKDLAQALVEQMQKKNAVANDDSEKGLIAARMVKCIAASKRKMRNPIEIATNLYGPDSVVTNALQAGDADAGGFTIDSNFAAEIIELLRNQAAVEGAGPRRVPLDSGTLTLPKHTAATSGGWIGEGENMPVTQPGFGQVKMTAKKYAGLVPISNDLLLYSSSDVDRLVRDDLVRTVALAEDLAFIRGDGTGGAPVGMRNIPGIQEFATNGTSVANITSDLGTAIQKIMEANVEMAGLHWFFTPKSWAGLFTARDANSTPVWQAMLDRGMLYGIPFTVTNQIPGNLGTGSDESEVYLVNMNDVVVGRASSIELDSSSEAAYYDGSSVQAAFSLDQTVVRIINRVDFVARHPESIVVITGVQWGA